MKALGTSLQYACFACRKCFKRPQFVGATNRFMPAEQQVAQHAEAAKSNRDHHHKCPECGGVAHYMGIDFKAPRRSDVRAWRSAEAVIASGGLFLRGTQRCR
ncbi:hypothetical protein C1704_16240 [Caldimonas caldifontis]|uniref:Uncharacterized protein n=1 Tax=Caldimonas caldifontis TaxID=1452508 RepID=A0A2S5SQM4_9BURK|nr:hypothetical protein C1704_16240 [Caldimonas caldifontis]